MVHRLILKVLLAYLMFMPVFCGIFPAVRSSGLLIAVLLYVSADFVRCGGTVQISRKLFFYSAVMLAAPVYTLAVTLFNGYSVGVNISAFTSPAVFCCVAGVYASLRRAGHSDCDILHLVISIADVQAVICILMVFFPGFKEIANRLYISSIENYYTSAVNGITQIRIYGIFGDYTYSGQIMMALTASVSLALYFHYGKGKYLLSSLLQLVSAVLNGRTGALLYAVCAAVSFMTVFSSKMTRRMLCKYFLFIGAVCACVLVLLMDAGISSRFGAVFGEVSSFLLGKNASYGSSAWFFPDGYQMLTGRGHRVFGNIGISMTGKSCDFGYVNDMFRGGLLYCVCYYIANFKFMMLDECQDETVNRKAVWNMRVCLLIFVLGANYKGECLGGSVIMSVVWIIALSLRSGGGLYTSHSGHVRLRKCQEMFTTDRK